MAWSVSAGIGFAIVVGAVAAPFVLALVFVGAAGGNASWGFGPATPNTEWWAVFLTLGAPLVALAGMVAAGIAFGRWVHHKRATRR